MHSSNDRIRTDDRQPLLPDAVVVGHGTDRRNPRAVFPRLIRGMARWAECMYLHKDRVLLFERCCLPPQQVVLDARHFDTHSERCHVHVTAGKCEETCVGQGSVFADNVVDIPQQQ